MGGAANVSSVTRMRFFEQQPRLPLQLTALFAANWIGERK
jgi:hypothetical protein